MYTYIHIQAPPRRAGSVSRRPCRRAYHRRDSPPGRRRAYMYVCIHVICIYIYIYIYICTHTHAHTYIYKCVCMYIYIYIYIYVYTSLSLSLYIYIYIYLSIYLSSATDERSAPAKRVLSPTGAQSFSRRQL